MIGKEICNYRIISKIGEGGMGAVYLAEHVHLKDKKAAIKVIKAEMVNDFTCELLFNEADNLAGLHHKNIVSFLNYHVDEEGNIYLVMENAEGVTLEDYIAKEHGLIVQDKICDLFDPILDGVGYAHSKGMLHCDIKPSNIIIGTDGDPKILDFGISRIIKDHSGDDPEENETVVMGTPSYMSPEQVRGKELDKRSDIYSLGVLLHQMLTGNPPYDTTTLTEPEINQKVIEEPLPRLKTYYKYVDDKVQKVVDKATAKNPADRYQTTEEFKKALRKAVHPWRPKMWQKIAAAIALLIICAGSIYAWDYNREKTKYYRDYVEQWGMPKGVGEISKKEAAKSARCYKIVTKRGKVLSVAHVNSKGNLIEDGESERIDRPVYQEFTYGSNGKVRTVCMMDRNRNVVCVKNYNDKLNTMVFQYDDEHGTERRLPKTGGSYVQKWNEDLNEMKGRVSRYWIDYDDNGYVSRIRYAGIDNTQQCNDDGIYGITYKRDDKGRVSELSYIDADSKPTNTTWGLGKKHYTYNDKDLLVKVVYLSYDGHTALDDPEGTAIYELKYDDNGNLINAWYKDGEGNLMYPKRQGYAGVKIRYNDEGEAVEQSMLNIEGKPMWSTQTGCAITKTEYDDNGYISKLSYFDSEDKPSETNGYSTVKIVNDACGNPLETSWLDIEGKPVTDAIAKKENKYDSKGRMIEEAYYDNEDKPFISDYGTTSIQLAYNDKNQITSFTFKNGTSGTDTGRDDGVGVQKNTYDPRGNLISTTNYAPGGSVLAENSENVAIWQFRYDENCNLMECQAFDAQKKRVNPRSTDKFSKIVFTYDEYGNVASERWYDADDNPKEKNGCVGYNYKRNRRGLILEQKPVDASGKLAAGKQIYRFSYDDRGNQTEQTLFDENGRTSDEYGVWRTEYTYDRHGNLIQERYFDINEILTDNENGYAIGKAEYDIRGNATYRAYFGSDGKPCLLEEGWSSNRNEYDKYGNMIKAEYFGTDGKHCSGDFPAVGIADYDKQGHMTSLKAEDGKGNASFFPNETFHKFKNTWDSRGNMSSQEYFGKSGEPVNCSQGYHKAVFKYDSRGRKTSFAYYGIDGKPAEDSKGQHKAVYEYDKKGNHTRTVYYFKDGSELGSTDDRDIVIRVTPRFLVRQLQSTLPIDMGPDFMDLRVESAEHMGGRNCRVICTIPYLPDEYYYQMERFLKEGMIPDLTVRSNGELDFEIKLYTTDGDHIMTVR